MKNITLLFVFFTISAVSFGQFSLLKDINQTEAGSNPQNFVEANGFVFFTVQILDGYELWQTDGTEVGTKRTFDNLIYSRGEDIFHVFNDYLYFFSANNRGTPNEIWRTNGNSTEHVVQTTKSMKLYFFNNAVHCFESNKLFKVRTNNYELVKEFAGANLDVKQVPVVVNNKLLFFLKKRANLTPNDVLEVWKSDGTELGTIKFKEIDQIPDGSISGFSSHERASILSGNTLFFVINRLIQVSNSRTEIQVELWKTDGTDLGTERVKIIQENNQTTYSEPDIFHMKAYNGGIVFIHGFREIWFSDGTEVGTQQLLSAYFNTSTIGNYWGEYDGKLFFAAGQTSVLDFSLWSTDGTLTETKKVKPLLTNSNSSPNQFTTYNGSLYFVVNYDQLWHSDGTESGTSFLSDIPKPNTIPSLQPLKTESIVASSDKLFFSNYSETTGGYELWISEGTTQSTRLLKNITTTTNSSWSTYSKKVKVGGKLYFYATDGFTGNEIWKTDGTTIGTERVTNFTTANIYFQEMVATDNNLYFTANSDTDFRNRLYRLNLFTEQVVEIPLSSGTPDGVNPRNLTICGDKLLFSGIHNYSSTLWAFDTVADEAISLYNNGQSITFYNGLIVFKNKIYFEYKSGIWTSDGTQAETHPILHNSTTNAPRQITQFAILKDDLFFTATYSSGTAQNTGLYKYDESNDVTILIKGFEIYTIQDRYSSFLYATNSFLFFREYIVADTFNLWKSDGSFSGTNLVKGMQSVGESQNFMLDSIAEKLYIFNYDFFSNSKLKLFVTDGTASGTELVINSTNNSTVVSTISLNGKLYFNMYDPRYGYELWSTDGTTHGTYIVENLREGSRNAIFDKLSIINGKLLFTTIDDNFGNELWTYKPTICEGNRNYSTKSGTWNDVSVWSCGSIPTSSDYVIIKNGHSVVIPTEYRAYSKFISTEMGAVLDIESGAVFKTGN